MWRRPHSPAPARRTSPLCTATKLPVDKHTSLQWYHIDHLVQDCSISSALAMEILQSCTKPWTWAFYAITADTRHTRGNNNIINKSTLFWHNDDVMCLLGSQITNNTSLFSTVIHTSKTTLKLHVSGPFRGNPPATGGLPSQRASIIPSSCANDYMKYFPY